MFNTKRSHSSTMYATQDKLNSHPKFQSHLRDMRYARVSKNHIGVLQRNPSNFTLTFISYNTH